MAFARVTKPVKFEPVLHSSSQQPGSSNQQSAYLMLCFQEKSEGSLAFLKEVVSWCSPRQQIHIILDNLSAHKTPAVRDFLEQHPRVQFHFTLTYSCWLNQVEIWFAKIEREVIARGIFTSVPDLARKLRRYINAYSANARPIQWRYSAPSRRIRRHFHLSKSAIATTEILRPTPRPR
jgi:transposase